MEILAPRIGTGADDGRAQALELATRAIESLVPAHQIAQKLANQTRDGRVLLGSLDSRPPGNILIESDGDVP